MFPCLGSVVYGHIDKSHVLYLRAIKYIFSFHILKHLMLLVWLGFQTKKLLHLPKIKQRKSGGKGENARGIGM